MGIIGNFMGITEKNNRCKNRNNLPRPNHHASTNECYYTLLGYPINLHQVHAELQYQIQQGSSGVQLTELQLRQPTT